MIEDSLYKVVFTYATTPFAVPIPTAIRKGNTMTFLFRDAPNGEEFDKIVKLASGIYVNPIRNVMPSYELFVKKEGSWVKNQ